jgi:Flp pilus assembly CpaE family ATPase
MQPDRVDATFLDRGVIHVTTRLDLLASLEQLGEESGATEDSLLSLLERLIGRYHYVFVDMPADLAERYPRVMNLPGLCILVSDPSLVATRDVARWRERIGPATPERPVLHIVNKAGEVGALPEAEFVQVLGHRPDLAIPYAREIAAAGLRGAKGLSRDNALNHALAPIVSNITGERPEAGRSLLARMFG